MVQTWLEQFIEWFYNAFIRPSQLANTALATDMRKANAAKMLQDGASWEDVVKVYPDLVAEDFDQITPTSTVESEEAKKFNAMRMLMDGSNWEAVQMIYPDLKQEDVPQPENIAVTFYKELAKAGEGISTAMISAAQTVNTAVGPTMKIVGNLMTAPLTTWIEDTLKKGPQAQSRISYAESVAYSAALLPTTLVAVAGVHLVGQALDLVHPTKKLGFEKLVSKGLLAAGTSIPSAFVIGSYLNSWVSKPISRQLREQYEESDLDKGQWDELLRRREITESEYESRMKYLGLPPDQRAANLKGVYNEIPLRTLKMLHKLEPFNDTELREKILKLGYDTDQVPRMMRYVKDAGTAQEKVLSIGQWLEAYERGLRDRRVVYDKLVEYGYDAESRDLALDLHTVKAMEEERGILDSEVKSLLQKGLITETRAREMWSNLRYSDDAIETKVMLTTWQRDQVARDASIATYRKLFAAGVMEEPEYRSKLSEMGLTTEGIEAEVASAILSTTEPVTRLTKSEVLTAYEKGITDKEFTEGRLRGMNIPEDDLRILLELNKPKAAA